MFSVFLCLYKSVHSTCSLRSSKVVSRCFQRTHLHPRLNSLFATFADLHVRKRATLADLHSYTHTYCSFVLLNEAITIVFGSHCLHALLIWLFGIFHIRFTGKKIQRVEHSTSKCRPNSSVPENNVAHGGFVLGKQRVKILEGYHP